MRIGICDDESIIVEYIGNIVETEYPKSHLMFKFTTAFSLMTYLECSLKGRLDALILDIDLGDDNGIQVAKMVRKKYPHIKIIFVSGHLEYVEDVFSVDPVFFISKPVKPEKVKEAIERVSAIVCEENKASLLLTNKSGISNVKLSKITYIESANRIIKIHTSDNRVREHYKKLGDILPELPVNFLRCHQSIIVNMDRIEDFHGETIELQSGEILPVSRSKCNEAKSSYIRYLGMGV